MLNAFSYTGGFGVAAALAGAAHVVNIDSSAPALKLARHNMEMNRIPPERYENREADVFGELRRFAEEGRKFDLVVLDPPKFIESQRALTRGCRAYQDIARLGFGLLAPGGLLFNFSCSGLMTPELFQKITADAAVEARGARPARQASRTGAGPPDRAGGAGRLLPEGPGHANLSNRRNRHSGRQRAVPQRRRNSGRRLSGRPFRPPVQNLSPETLRFPSATSRVTDLPSLQTPGNGTSGEAM